MSTVLAPPFRLSQRAAWLAILAGLAALYLPTYVELSRTLWREDAYAHGPIVLAVFAWLVWRARDALSATAATAPERIAGAASVAFGLALYIVGRSQAVPLFEVASHLPVIAGVVLLTGGIAAMRRLVFPLVLLAFLVPLPGFILDAATTPLKGVVSILAAAIARALGVPVEREGVVLVAGDHEMLLADACSGLNSIYSLAALTLIYTQLTAGAAGQGARLRRLALLLAAIVPVAILFNAMRVALLVLVTVNMGEDVAQGMLHGVLGMAVFLAALGTILAIDRAVFGKPQATTREFDPGALSFRAPGMATTVVLALAMLGAAFAASAMKPVRAEGPGIDLERVVPAAFGDWRIDPEIVPVAPTPDVQQKLDRLYSQVVNRAYVNSAGDLMMLTIAYGGDQSDALKVHRQENCYRAQGFDIHALAHGRLEAAGRDIPVTRMVAVRGERVEPVTYWFTMGDRVVLGRGERLATQLDAGFHGRVLDGMLVRVSSLSDASEAGGAGAFAEQQAFADALVAALPPDAAVRFVGARS
jgi:EpsI family protein